MSFSERALQRGETNVNPSIFALERFADGRVRRLEPDSLILRQTPAHLLPEPNASSAIGMKHDRGKREEEPGPQAHVGHPQSSIIIHRMISPPSHSAVTPERPRRAIASSRVSTSGTMVSGSSHWMRSTKARTSWHGSSARLSNDDDVSGVVSARQCQCQRITGHPNCALKGLAQGARDDESRFAAAGPLEALAMPTRRSAKSRDASSFVSYTMRPVGAAPGLANGTGAPRSPTNPCHQNGPSAPRASPRTASRARVWRASAGGGGDDRPSRREMKT